MKKILFIVAFVVLSALTSLEGSAQNLKVGHLDQQAILKNIPEWQIAEKDFENFMNMKQTMLKDKQKALDEMIKDYQTRKDAGTLSPKQEEDLIVKIQNEQQTFQKLQASAQEEVNKREKDLTEPIQKRLNEALKIVAREGNYTYIIDISQGFTLYIDPTGDVSALVLEKFKTIK